MSFSLSFSIFKVNFLFDKVIKRMMFYHNIIRYNMCQSFENGVLVKEKTQILINHVVIVGNVVSIYVFFKIISIQL